MSMGSLATAIVTLVLGIAVWIGTTRLFRGCARTTYGSVAGAVIWACLLLLWVCFEAVGVVRCDTPGYPMLVGILLGCLSALTRVAPGIRGRFSHALMPLRPVVVVLCVPVAFFLLEWPYNDRLFSMDAEIVRLNLCLIGLWLLAVWFICQRKSGGLLGYLAACLVIGLANYFVCLFKEQTILPADLLAIGTAAEVSAGYVYELYTSAVVAICVFLGMALLLAALPAPKLGRKRIALNLVLGLTLLAMPMVWYDEHDIKSDYGVRVDVWSTRESYQTFGTMPSFLQRMQEVEPQIPSGYSTEGAAALQAELAAAWDEAHPGYPQTLDEARLYQLESTGSDELPTVVAIMNESFSDLSAYPGTEGIEGIPYVDALETVEHGSAFTGARGGGTCNSEFEYLTGASLGCLGGGVYPYMFYDLGDVESLPSYFSSLGYRATAIHPAAASNWRRDVVYRRLGFSSFLSEADMPSDASTLRNLITDRTTYDVILGLLDENAEAQFIFDVTLQNHGGYETGLLDEYPYDAANVRGQTIDGMSEYLSCISASEDDLSYLIGQLEGLDRKVILVFFGDHQPGFNDQIAEAAYGVAVDDLTIDQVQQRFETPYFIWANYDVELFGEGGGATEEDLSFGYLMAHTAYAAGLPLTEFQKALLRLRTTMPAINLNGYQDADGAWYWIGQDGPASVYFDEYATLQYANLFDASGNAAFDVYIAEREEDRGGV